MTLAKTLGISEEDLLTLRAEAQRTFESGAMASLQFYKTLGRAALVRMLSWYRGSVDRASGRYAGRLIETATYHRGCGPEQRRAIEEEAQSFARERIAEEVVRYWMGFLFVERIEPWFTKMLAQVVTELADHETSLISEAKANLKRAAAIYGGARKELTRRKRRAFDVARSSREKEIRDIISLGCKGLPYCREMDARKIRAKPEWRSEGWPGKYEAAYKQSEKWRKRIQQEKWRIGVLRTTSAGSC